MGPAGRLGLCLVLGALSWAHLETLQPCPQCLPAFCLNSTHCGCPRGYWPPPWPQHSPRSEECDDVDECAEGGRGQCGRGFICHNTPGSFECHCPDGRDCSPVTVFPPPAVTLPPDLCADEQSDCELAQTLTHLHGLLRGGGDPHHILQELLTLLDGVSMGDMGSVPQRHRWVTALLAATEGLVRGVGTLLPPATVTTVTSVTSNHTVLRVTTHQGPSPVFLRVPGVELDVPGEVAGDNDTGPALVALLSHPRLGRLLEGARKVQWEGWEDLPAGRPPQRGGVPSYRVLSPVATVLATHPQPPLSPSVTLRFQHELPDPRLGGRVLCAFWHPQEQLWATAGCREVTSPPFGPPPNPPSVTCACDHLTSFAVLLAFHELPDNWVLDVVTKVGLGVSVVSLVVAAATFLLCRALKGLRTTLHLHLSLSLLLAHSTFLLGIGSTQHPTACAVVAGLLHFSFLAAFCWMGLEGLHLYVLLVRVFVPSWLRVRHLLLAGYGPPALVLTIAAIAFPQGFGTTRYCWLSLERGFRWSFQAPVCIIIALNAVILVVTVWKLVQKFNDVNPDMGHLRKMRVLVATGMGQLCLLGTGWALGLAVGVGGLPGSGGPLAPLPLLFCAFNASQGLFILLFHCLAHPQVRDAYRACLCPGTKRYSEFTSNTSNTSNTRVTRQ